MYEILLFFVGFIWEILATIDIQAVQKGQAAKSAIVTIILAFSGDTIFYNIIKSPDAYGQFAILSLGCGLGAYITIKWNKK